MCYYNIANMKNDEKKIVCPDCGAEIAKEAGMMIGDILECSECGTEVEVLSLEPLECRELFEEK
jgi:alpha-aminoadipate carrier protein LysW